MNGKKWIPRTLGDYNDNAGELARNLEISPMLVMLLRNRGIDDFESMKLFLNPTLQNLSMLDAWSGLEESARILSQAVLDKKRICVWGDYDVDGITSTVLVKDFFRQLGVDCGHHVPNRLEEGYGLNEENIAKLAKDGVEVLLTVDSGISDNAAVEYAKTLGLTLVISDHHLPGDCLPCADGIFNPRVGQCPCPHLAGVGVAFFLMAAVNAQLAEHGWERVDIRTLLDLVALGTLADVVNVCGENRILIKNGMLTLDSGARPGIAALKRACNFSPTAKLGAGQLVFSLAPRINAAGRLGSSETAIQLLLAKDLQEAIPFADELVRLNLLRREEEDGIFDDAVRQASDQVLSGRLGLVLYSEAWHPGVIGIVASRIVEKFHRPTIVLTAANGHLKGSARSFARFHLHEAFTQLSEKLLSYGGHRMAAGVSLERQHLGALSDGFNDLVEAYLGNGEPQGECLIDAELPLSLAADFTVLKELELLQPYGNGNPEPTFASPPILVKNVIPKNGFCMIDLEDPETKVTLRAKGWRELANFPQAMRGAMVRIAYTPRIDRYNGMASVELRLKDWKQASDKVESFITVQDL